MGRFWFLCAFQVMLVILWFLLLAAVSVTQVLTCFRRDTVSIGLFLCIKMYGSTD